MTRKHRSQPVPVASRAVDAQPQQAAGQVQWAKWAIFALLILVPLFTLSPDLQLPNPTDMPRRLLLALVAGLLLAGIVHGWALRGQLRWHRHVLDIAVLLFFLGACIASVRGAYPHISLFSTLWVQDFTALPALGIGIALYFGIKEFINGGKAVEDTAFLMVLVGGVEALIALIDHFGHLGLHPAFSGPQGLGRLVGTLGNPMFAGTFFAMLIPLAIGVALGASERRRRPWLLASLVLMTFALLLTSTRSAWLGLAGALLVFALLALWRRQTTGQRLSPLVLAVSLAVLVVVLALGLLMPQVRARISSITNAHDNTRQTRVVYMTTAWRLFRARPLSGWGPCSIRPLFPQYRPSSKVLENALPLNRDYSASLPHNLPLQIAAEMGLCGLLPFALLLLLLLITGCRFVALPGAPGWLGLGLLGLLLAYVLSNLASYDNAATMGQFWIGLSLFAALTASQRPLLGGVSLPPALLRFAAVTLYIVVVLAALAQTLGTCYLANALGILSRLEHDSEDPYQHSREAVSELQTALTLVPLPDPVGYAALTKAYQMEMAIYAAQHPQSGANDPTLTSLYSTMFQTGEQTLKILDREPTIQRMLLSASMADKTRLAEADRLSARLIAHEPHSSEVWLLAAQLSEKEGKLTQALKQTTEAGKLDDTNPDVPAMRAHLQLSLHQQEFVKDSIPAADPRLNQVAVDFQHALAGLGRLSDSYRQEYATVLFLLGQTEQAIVQGQALPPNSAEQQGLRTTIAQIGQIYHRAAEANRAVLALQTQPTTTPTTPAPSLNSPMDLFHGQ